MLYFCYISLRYVYLIIIFFNESKKEVMCTAVYLILIMMAIKIHYKITHENI